MITVEGFRSTPGSSGCLLPTPRLLENCIAQPACFFEPLMTEGLLLDEADKGIRSLFGLLLPFAAGAFLPSRPFGLFLPSGSCSDCAFPPLLPFVHDDRSNELCHCPRVGARHFGQGTLHMDVRMVAITLQGEGGRHGWRGCFDQRELPHAILASCLLWAIQPTGGRETRHALVEPGTEKVLEGFDGLWLQPGLAGQGVFGMHMAAGLQGQPRAEHCKPQVLPALEQGAGHVHTPCRVQCDPAAKCCAGEG